MCTVSFVPTRNGFRLAMNRDEKRTRIHGLPPTILSLSGRRVILPREPNGGTWIAVNDAGVCLALINWHQIERQPRGEIVSRGVVIDSLAHCRSIAQVAHGLERLPLRQFRPFRLLAIDSGKQLLIECRWDVRRLEKRRHKWRTGHWFSSGFAERKAEHIRAQVCLRHGSVHSASSLRKLHRSHSPRPGPFSICMHRKDAATVSYGEVVVTPRRATMRYADGPPCRGARRTVRSLAL